MLQQGRWQVMSLFALPIKPKQKIYFWNRVRFEEIRGLFFHMNSFLIRQFSYYGTINRFNRVSIRNKTFSASKNSCSSLTYLDKLL